MVLAWLGLAVALNIDNVDRLEPIVRKSPDNAGDGDMFGFSVVLHQMENASVLAGDFSGSLENTRIVVGAPRGSYPGGLASGLPGNSQGALPNTGLVYVCPVEPGSCGPLTGNGQGADLRLFDGEGNAERPVPVTTGNMTTNDTEQDEEKSGQLMGGTLFSNGDNFMACAPVWVSLGTSENADTSRAQGRCYLSDRSLSNFMQLRPCTTGDALAERSDSQCQAGFSATVFTSGDNSYVVLGGPGSYRGRGRVYAYSSADNYANFTSTSNENDSLPLALDFVYDGWSMVSGRIISTQSKSLVTALPRYNSTIYNGSVLVRDLNNLDNVTDEALEGQQLGEYFGWTMATADLNGDGYDELLVGAPMYSTSSIVEQGRVYVFENIGGSVNSTPVMLFGSNATNARFGHAIVNLGDINGDDIDDVAISAPYENQEGSSVANGTVYVYYGSGSSPVIADAYQQRITARDILQQVPSLSELNTFGFSLSGGMDVDGNLYNDLLIGAQASQTAVLLRTMSLAAISIIVGTDRDTVQLDVSEETNSSFLLSVCASYTGRGLEGRLTTELLIQEITALNGVNRLYFLVDGAVVNEYRRPFTFDRTGEVFCRNLTVFVVRISELNDVRTPLTLEALFPNPVRAAAATDGNRPLTDFRDSPLVQVSGDGRVEVDARANCSISSGMEQCLSDLTLALINVTYRDSDGDVSVGVDGSPRDNLAAGDASLVDVYINLSNRGNDPAFGSMLNITIPSIFTFARVNPAELDVTCEEGMGEQQVCGLPSYLRAGGELVLILRFNVNSGLTGAEGTFNSSLSIGLPPQTQDRETDTTNNVLELSFTVVAEADLRIASLNFTTAPATYVGQAPDQITSVSSLGGRFVLSVSLTNSGPTDVPRARLRVSLPYQDSSTGQFYFLYPDTINVISESSNIVCDTAFLNPDRLNGTDNRRRRRSVVLDEARVKRQENANIINTEINCSPDSDSADSCVAIQCSVSNFTQFSTHLLTVNGNLDERFYSGETGSFTYTAYAVVEFEGSGITEPAPNNNAIASSPYRLSLRVVQEDEPFPIWIPIVCAIAAVILLILLIIPLYFIGFFRRRKPGQDGKETVGGDFEVREIAPEQPDEGKPAAEEGDTADTTAPNGTEHEGSPEKVDEVEPEVEPEKDPEETSL